MKAVVCNDWCEPSGLAIEEVLPPQAGAGQVVVKVASAALNFPDILMVAGKYQVRPPLPFTPGFEVAGTVDAIGTGVVGLEPGQRVLAQVSLGGFAELVAAPAASVQRIPQGLSDDEAAAFPLVYQTSYFALALRGGLAPGETVLIHSAAGGVGLAAVQLARALGAGKIIGTAGSSHKLDTIRAAGADLAINYHTEDFVEIVKRETAGRGADVIFDPVGGEIGQRSTKCIAFEGRLVIIGFTSGAFSHFASNHILVKNYSVVGLHWGLYQTVNPAKVAGAWKTLWALYAEGKLRPMIGRRYPMSQVGAAMEYLASRAATGKIVLHW